MYRRHPDTSFTHEVRKQLQTHGLTPPNVESHALQAQRCSSGPPFLSFFRSLLPGLKQLESKKTPIEKYIYLSNLRNTNVHLFYRLVMNNLTVSPDC